MPSCLVEFMHLADLPPVVLDISQTFMKVSNAQTDSDNIRIVNISVDPEAVLFQSSLSLYLSLLPQFQAAKIITGTISSVFIF